MIRVLSTIIFALAIITSAQAEERATLDEAKAFAEKAVEYVKANGLEKAVTAFQDPKGQFQDRDLYVIAFDRHGKALANGKNPALVGRDLSNHRDVDGKPMVQEVIALKSADWVEYKWRNPQTSTVEQKQSYMIPVATDAGEILVGVGAYKP